MQEYDPNNNENIISSYQKLLDEAKVNPDPMQEEVVQKLYQLEQSIELYMIQNSSSFFQKILSSNNEENITKGMYIYGDVGRGKSMLMDLFFQMSSVSKKRRVHFHAFMLEVHKKLFQLRNDQTNGATQDPLVPLAKNIAKDANLLCFDEFQVTDVADAMLLGRLFTQLFNNGVVVVITSNRHPDELYKDGLQRARFLPFIELLKNNVDVVKLDAQKDYRLDHLKSLSTIYYTPLDRKSHSFIQNTFYELTNKAKFEQRILEVSGRKVVLNKTHGDVAWVSFADLCEKPLGAADYVEIAREFSTLLMSDIPKLSMENRNEAKRFVTLIDELYEHKVKLICTADALPFELYTQGDGSFEFERTASRLVEMQNTKYLKKGHLS